MAKKESKMVKKESELIKCENKGGTWIDGECALPKKPKPIEQLKIKVKF